MNALAILALATVLNRPINLVSSVFEEAVRQDADPILICVLVDNESEFKPAAINYNENGTSDWGLFQINSRYHDQHRKDLNAHILKGIAIWKDCLQKKGYDYRGALEYYNSGSSGKGMEYADDILKDYWRVNIVWSEKIRQLGIDTKR